MGVCNCKESNFSKNDVDVDRLDILPNKNNIENKSKLIRIKSIKYNDNKKNYQTNNKIINSKTINYTSSHNLEEGSIIDSMKNTYNKLQNDSSVTHYDIPEDEIKKIKTALSKHFLFNEINEEALYN
jgi:hypothetical protein